MRFELFQGGAAFEETQYGAHLAGGAARDVEKAQELGGSAAFEALGNVVGDRERGAVELVAFGPGEAVAQGVEQIVALAGQPERVLPDGEIFEAVIGGHGLGDLRSEI